MQLHHPIPPLYTSFSEILILGSFPSVKSREQQFFYSHPQNRFWKVLAALYGENPPENISEKRALICDHQLALWDVIASCEITGSADSSIKNVVPNDLSAVLDHCPIRRIFVNGRTAQRLYHKFLFPQIEKEAIYLPSTSPANASVSFPELIRAWSVITEK